MLINSTLFLFVEVLHEFFGIKVGVYIALWSQINFADLSLEEAITKAQAEDKYIFIDVYTTWCGPCKKLDRVTFQSSEV